MKRFRVESETQWGQAQPGPGGVCGIVLSPDPKTSSLLWLSQAFWGAVELKALCEEKWELPQAGLFCCWSSMGRLWWHRYPSWGILGLTNGTPALKKVLH